ncbi:MAG: aminotransferase class IV [Pseudomonadota bacterium]
MTERQLSNERVVWLNGEIVPESQATVHIHDRGFLYGDAVFDTARTFGGRIYRLQEHIDRLMRSLRYLRIDPGMSAEEIARVSEEVVERNRHLLGEHEDYWVFQRITRGSAFPDGPGQRSGPTVIVLCVPLPFGVRAPLFRDGIEVVIPSTRRVAPDAVSPNAKTHNYLNFVVAAQEVGAGGGWPVLLDHRGFLCEGNGSNIFLVRDGVVMTPQEQFVLAGISRKVVMELCEKLGIPCRETDLTAYDVATADEAFITSTSLCMCPVRSFDGESTAVTDIPGPVTKRLMDAYAEEVGHDFVGQYLAHLTDDAKGGTGL